VFPIRLGYIDLILSGGTNGPQGGQDARADPFRGKKWSSLEGGNWVPCIISWPGTIPESLNLRLAGKSKFTIHKILLQFLLTSSNK